VDKKLLALLIFAFSCLEVFGQQITPSAHFSKDSIKIGEEVPYSLWVRYPKSQDVIFPDSLYDFSPFEINRRTYFATKSDSTESLDSVVYYLSTFEIDTIQYLQLPVYLITEFDSVELLPPIDSIILDQVVLTIPDSIAVITNTNYQKVPLAFNYPYFTAGLIILAIVALVVFLVFGGRIRKMIQVYWIKRRHKRFTAMFKDELNSKPLVVEKLLIKWKVYLEKLESTPYTKYTSKEIIKTVSDESLKEPLSTIDRFIYTTEDKPDTTEAFQALLQFSIMRYESKINQIKHG
jgi:hypothetical protein